MASSKKRREPMLNRFMNLRYDKAHANNGGERASSPDKDESEKTGRADMEVTGPGSVQSSFPIKSIQKAVESSKTTSVQPTSPSDELEISSVGKKLDALNQMPDVRAERLVQIKAAIEADEYETPARLEATVDRLLDQIRDEKQHG